MKTPPLFTFLALALSFPALMAQGVLKEPQGLTATDGEYADTVVVTWKVVPGADRYRVFRSFKNDWLTATGVGSTEDTVFFDTFAEEKPTRPCFYWVVAERRRERGPFSKTEKGSLAPDSENYFTEKGSTQLHRRPAARRPELRRLRSLLPRS